MGFWVVVVWMCAGSGQDCFGIYFLDAIGWYSVRGLRIMMISRRERIRRHVGRGFMGDKTQMCRVQRCPSVVGTLNAIHKGLVS